MGNVAEVKMAYCCKCGHLLKEDDRFCSGCGIANDLTVLPLVVPPVLTPPITNVVVVTPKRAGWLGFKAFLVAFFVYLIGAASLPSTSGKVLLPMWMAFPFGIGAVYVIAALRRWKRQNEPVTGAAMGWILAVFMGMICFGGLMGGSGSRSSSTSDASGGSSGFVDPKDILMREVKLKSSWSKGGFDNVIMADFTVQNPTQYRFKDVEIKCTHFAPSGTEIDSNTRTIYQVFEAHSTQEIRQMNMGLIHSQVGRSGCQIVNLTVLFGEAAKSSV